MLKIADKIIAYDISNSNMIRKYLVFKAARKNFLLTVLARIFLQKLQTNYRVITHILHSIAEKIYYQDIY